jgi:hypothetical protein
MALQQFDLIQQLTEQQTVYGFQSPFQSPLQFRRGGAQPAVSARAAGCWGSVWRPPINARSFRPVAPDGSLNKRKRPVPS